MFKLKQLSILIALGLISTAALGSLLYYVFPTIYPDWFFEIAFFFLVFESLLMLFVVNRSTKVSPKKMVNVYLLAKVIKMLTSLAFAGIYALVVKEDIMNFIMVFATFYVIYLVIETYLYSKVEWHIGEKNNS